MIVCVRWHGQNTEAALLADEVCPTIGAYLGMGGGSMNTPVFIVETRNQGDENETQDQEALDVSGTPDTGF